MEGDRTILLGSELCAPCQVAKQKYAAEIESGQIESVDIQNASDELINTVADCLTKAGQQIGLPVLVELEDGQVKRCQLGIEAEDLGG